MKKAIYLGLIIVLLAGFGCGAKDDAAIVIGDIKISTQEFEDSFKASRFASVGKEGRKVFLDNYIASKLILREAENMGLDKDPRFLRDIQLFWEKALLKLVLSKKANELASEVRVSDQQIRKYYQEHKKSQFADKKLSQVYDQIRWWLMQEKQSRAMKAWADTLKTKANIKIDYRRLGIAE